MWQKQALKVSFWVESVQFSIFPLITVLSNWPFRMKMLSTMCRSWRNECLASSIRSWHLENSPHAMAKSHALGLSGTESHLYQRVDFQLIWQLQKDMMNPMWQRIFFWSSIYALCHWLANWHYNKLSSLFQIGLGRMLLFWMPKRCWLICLIAHLWIAMGWAL